MTGEEFLIYQLELEGWERGSPPFQRELRKRKIVRCLEYQGLDDCSQCQRQPFCSLIQEHREAERERLLKKMEKTRRGG